MFACLKRVVEKEGDEVSLVTGIMNEMKLEEWSPIKCASEIIKGD